MERAAIRRRDPRRGDLGRLRHRRLAHVQAGADKAKCTNCLTCWVFCPDSSVIFKDGKHQGFDLKHCKGCGICAHECPKKIQAITMVEEAEFKNEGVCHAEG